MSGLAGAGPAREMGGPGQVEARLRSATDEAREAALVVDRLRRSLLGARQEAEARRHRAAAYAGAASDPRAQGLWDAAAWHAARARDAAGRLASAEALATALRARAEGFEAALRQAAAAGPGAEPLAAGAPSTLLSQAVRAIPPAVEAFRLGGREALALDFGRALGVELRAVPGGVSLVLAAGPALLPAARAELPGLLRTLAARGVPVVRAEARHRGGGEGRGR